MKSVFTAAVIAAACSGVAMAGELKQDQKTAAAVVKGTVMNDAEMDKVTAAGFIGPGYGLDTANSFGGNGLANANLSLPAPGFGRCTAGFHGGQVTGGCAPQ